MKPQDLKPAQDLIETLKAVRLTLSQVQHAHHAHRATVEWFNAQSRVASVSLTDHECQAVRRIGEESLRRREALLVAKIRAMGVEI